MDERIFWGIRNKTSSFFAMVGHSLPQVLTAANLPCHTGSPYTPGFLNSLVLLIHKGVSWCSFTESLLWWSQNWLSALHVILFFWFFQHLSVDVFPEVSLFGSMLSVEGGVYLTASSFRHKPLPLSVPHKTPWSAYSWWLLRTAFSLTDLQLWLCNTDAIPWILHWLLSAESLH